MRFSMLMMVAGAVIVFVAPVANARAVKLHHTPAVHKIAKSNKAGKNTKGAKLKPKAPIYISVPGSSGAPAIATDPTDPCVEYMVDCTDQQLCESFGLNCSTAGDQPGIAQPLASDTSADASAPSQTQSDAQPSDSSGTVSASTSGPTDDGGGPTILVDSSNDC